MDNQTTHYKHQLILKYVAPAIGAVIPNDEHLINELLIHCRLRTITKSQFIEEPGDWKEGHIWLSIQAMAHSYYFCVDKQANCGRQIWKKQEFIFDSHSFYEQHERCDYIQAIEPGTFISISYPALQWFQEKFPLIKQKLEQLSRFQQLYYRDRIQLLNKPTLERVRSYIATHPLFSRIASNTVNGMHIGLTRQGYENQVRKLK